MSQRYTYNFPTTVRFGAGVITELSDHLKGQNLKRPLLVSDSVVVQLDFFGKILAQLSAAHLRPEVFSDIHKNPVKSDVLKATDAFRQFDCDCMGSAVGQRWMWPGLRP